MTARLPRVARGQRPAFHEQAAIDRLIAMVTALAGEVSVLRDRVDTLEILGAEAGWLQPGAVEAFVPNLEQRKVREARREVYVGHVFAIMSTEIENLEQSREDADYWKDIAAIEEGEV